MCIRDSLNSDQPKNAKDAAERTGKQPVVIQQLSLSAFEANLPKTLVKTVSESTYADEIRGLITRWIQDQQNPNGLTKNQIETIFKFELDELSGPLNKELKDVRSKVRLQAAEAIAKTGGRDAIKMLQPFVRGSEVVVAYPDPVSGKSLNITCLLYTSPSPRDATLSRMPSSA